MSMSTKVYHTGRLSPAELADLVAKEKEIHCDCGWRQWELPLFAEYGRNYVLEVDGDFAGSAQMIRDWDDPETVYLAGFGIAPAKQKQGYGTVFIEELVKLMADEGFAAVELSVRPDNAPAMKIYEDAGFVEIESHENRYGPGEDRLIMRLDINGK
jgi:[ribosomal protein S18]-alanine N-acetyltransferase